MLKIAKENLSALFQAIAGEQDLYLPVNNNGQVNFAAWAEGADVDLDTLKSVKSPKDAFFPQSENLYTVKTEDKKLKVEAEKLQDKDFVVFGMKASASTFNFLSSVFTVYKFSLCGKKASFGDFTLLRVSKSTSAPSVHAAKFTCPLLLTGKNKSCSPAIAWNNAERFSFAILYITLSPFCYDAWFNIVKCKVCEWSS